MLHFIVGLTLGCSIGFAVRGYFASAGLASREEEQWERLPYPVCDLNEHRLQVPPQWQRP